MATDLFFLESDRHRVVLLAQLLKRLGISANLTSKPTESRSDPALVICTTASLRERWLTDLFGHSGRAVALLLDNAPLPRLCTQAVDLTSWPARSADAEVAGLVRWLKSPEPVVDFGVAAARRLKSSRAEETLAGHVADKRDGPSPWLTAGLLAALVTGFGLLLWSSMPDGEATESAAAKLEEAVELEGAAQLEAPVEPGSLPQSAADTVSTAGGRTDGPGAPQTSERDQPSAGTASAEQQAAFRHHNDALSRLCRAPSPASASAWLGTLNWQQRRGLEHAPCIAQLAARPGFEQFANALELYLTRKPG
jgi:hypothetical protein